MEVQCIIQKTALQRSSILELWKSNNRHIPVRKSVLSYTHYNENFEEWIQDDVFLLVETTVIVWLEMQNG